MEKVSSIPVKKMFWPIFSRISKHDKRQGTTHKDPQGNLTITVEATETFFQNLKGC